MKWIKNLSAKMGGASRRRNLDSDNRSPDRKLLSSSRRSLKRKALSSPGSQLTENSSSSSVEGSPARSDAKWRVENILVNGPPSEAEWWSADSPRTAYTSSPDANQGYEEHIDASSSLHSGESGRFYNCGNHAWEAARVEWRKPTEVDNSTCDGESPSPPRPPVRYDQIARGIRGTCRVFELPHRMKLRELVGIYTEIWECDSDPW